MPEPVTDTWLQIIRWLGMHAPATAAQVRGPADPAVVVAMERDAGVSLPAELRVWWPLADGFESHAIEALIPWIHVPLPTATARDTHGSLLALWSTVDWPDPYSEDAMAGTSSHRYQEAFVPISADHCGQVLFVDLRPGPWHGCISEWDHEQGSLDPPLWRGIDWMLTDIANALDHNEPVLTDHTRWCQAAEFRRDSRAWPIVDETGELHWDGSQRRHAE